MDVTWQHLDEAAVRREQLGISQASAGDPDGCVFAFISPGCDLAAAGRALAATGLPVIGCTSSGQIGRGGFEAGGLTMAHVRDGLRVRSFIIRSLVDLEQSIEEAVAAINAADVLDQPGRSVFGVIFVDGLAAAEERLMAGLHQRLPLLPVVGGSAGDDLRFKETHVYWDGGFRSGVAVLHILSTTLKVTPLKFQHHLPGEQKLVMTRADPATRVIHEINGLPAAEAYASILGVAVADLTDALIAEHPLMLRIGSEYFTRSIAEVRADGTLRLLCAIDEGLVLRVGNTDAIVDTVEAAFAAARARVGEPLLVIGCDCILRRLELERVGLVDDVGRVFAANRVIGFSTYGEQFNALHANQTFTGFMLGAGA